MQKKSLDQEDEATAWLTNNGDTRIAQYLMNLNKGNYTKKFGQLIDFNNSNIFLQKSFRK